MTAARRRQPSLPRSLALAIGIMAVLAQTTPGPVRAAGTWELNLFNPRAFLYQDPYGTACTAASTMIMLNTIAYRHTGGPGFIWTPSRIKNSPVRSFTRDLTSILYFARAHDTLTPLGSGSDGHGWRNALNAYGWGRAAMTDPAQAVYDDLEFTSYDAAVHAAVRAIAEFGMPVGIVSWAGRHAQVMTGYIVDGEDPATSDAFTVRYVYLTDPLYADHIVNFRLTYSSFRAGMLKLRFQPYRETDSPYDDPYTPGWKRSAVAPTRGPSEWYHRWVIVAPIRAGLPPIDPIPTPTPTPDPNASAAPDPSLVTDPSAAPGAPGPSAPDPSAGPSAPADASPALSPDASPAPSDAPSGSTGPSPSAAASAAA